MPTYKYSIQTDPDRSAKASARGIDVSPKAAREICHTIKGMTIHKCVDYLEAVIEKKSSVPYRRHKRKVGHKSDLVGWAAGRYPVKTAKEILKVVKNLENNAENNQLQLDRCVIVHAVTLQGTKQRAIFYRAHGRSSPKVRQNIHVELVAEVAEV
ncbi:MAG: 50S ribosomal protein L22 [Candidatus Heimdallarchaeota archaeon]|nr:50S ribosomal protein L22 [Candidatus Heimdallarchaeota archaeon]